MSSVTQKILLLLTLVTFGLSAKAQRFADDFENQFTWYPPWINIKITTDSTALDGGFVCLCDTTQEYGLGFTCEAGKLYPGQNINLQYEFLFRTDNGNTQATAIFSIDDDKGNRYWQSYPLAKFLNDTAFWSTVSFNLNFPTDYIGDGKIKTFIWNHGKENLYFDNAVMTVTPFTMSFLPEIGETENGERRTENLQLLAFSSQLPLTYPIGLLDEYILDGDTLRDFQLFNKTENGKWETENELLTTSITIDSSQLSALSFQLSTTFHKDCLLLRQTLVVPFIDSTITVYRRNMETENGELSQKEYYLDREGFKVGEGDRSVISYHQEWISSTQLDAENRTAYFNLDYWRDHPMIHYPLSDTLQDVFEDHSCRPIHQGMQWTHTIILYTGSDIIDLPRIMPVPYGYASGIIFTEHADWTDLRTHRAVLFGSENITKAKKSTGGFVYYGIPVTKSVFYNNPDGVTNDEISHGAFKGLHTTIKTHRKFENLLYQLHDIGFDLCLHTPEQYTTTPENLDRALAYMRRHFKSTTWIDHGYNNSARHNREDIVCDGLNWKTGINTVTRLGSYRIKYLWNPYYEENRMEQWCFDNNLTQPYPGFGDALPNRQITTLEVENGTAKPSTKRSELKRRTENSQLSALSSQLLTWCTPSTLEVYNDYEWDYYFSEERLEKLVDQHSVHIIHAYPAWVNPAKGFWTYDADSTIIAQPGFNRALARIATLRDEHKMLPMTIKTYLDYYSSLLSVGYEIIDAEHIQLHSSRTIKGFTLLCPAPIRFEDNRYYEFRKAGDMYYIWFDLKAGEEVRIKLRAEN